MKTTTTVRAKYIGILTDMFGASYIEALMNKSAFLGPLNAMCAHEAAKGLDAKIAAKVLTMIVFHAAAAS